MLRMQRLFDRHTLSSMMLLAVGIALVTVAIPLITLDISAKHQEIHEMAERGAEAALDMLEGIHIQPTVHHMNSDNGEAKNESLDDSLEHFSEVNENVNLWLVMGPKILAYKRAAFQRDLKTPLDEVDAVAIETGKLTAILTDDNILRVTRPVIMGQGYADGDSCRVCHMEKMGIQAGEVIGAYSAAVDLSLELAAWRRAIFENIIAAAIVVAVTLTLIFILLRIAALQPLRELTSITHRLANGDTKVEIIGKNRIDELGMMARSLDIFRTNLVEKKTLEAEQAATLKLLEEQKLRLEVSLDKERELNGLQRQFVSMVSHEFRTPLAIIDGNAQRIIKRRQDMPPERLHNKVDKIRNSVLRLINLMESVLNASRLEAGAIKYQPVPSNLGNVIEEVCANHREINPSHELIVDLDRLPENLCLDTNLMRQVVSNLISNAIKYTPAGTRIWVEGRTNTDDVAISVRDEGPGIPPIELEKLFDRFFRGSSSTGIIGTGIGLHIVQVFVELHGGRVDVVSTEGEGATFTVVLPASVSVVDDMAATA